MIKNVAFGIIIDDIVFPDGSTQMSILGGGGVQTVWGMAVALGSGESVGLAAGIGDDLSDELLNPLYAAGINLDGLRRTPHPTPRAWQITEYDGRRTQVWRTQPKNLGEQLAMKWEYLPESYQQAQNFHRGIHPEDAPPSLALQLKKMGKTVSLEAFKAPVQPLSPVHQQAIFESCSIFSAATAELEAIIGYHHQQNDLFSIFARSGARYLVERKGKSGAVVYYCLEQQKFTAPAIETPAIDETGAGNAFCGAFLARIQNGVSEALCHGITAASYMIEQVGIPHGLPDSVDYENRFNMIHGKIEIQKMQF